MVLESLIGIHCFTGCDTTSAFAGRRKVKPLTLMSKDQEYVEIFASILGIIILQACSFTIKNSLFYN